LSYQLIKFVSSGETGPCRASIFTQKPWEYEHQRESLKSYSFYHSNQIVYYNQKRSVVLKCAFCGLHRAPSNYRHSSSILHSQRPFNVALRYLVEKRKGGCLSKYI
jgi:hypothetical protein